MCVASCSKSKQKDYVTYGDMEEEFEASLTNADSTEVLEMSNDFMSMLQDGDIEGALAQLSEVNADGQVVPLSTERRDQLIAHFTQFPVLKYELDYFAFSISTINDVKYNITFEEPDHKMAFMLNPIKKDGEWYLCTKQEGMHSKTEANPINPAAIIEEH
jgi:hypothetical protein